MFCADGKKNVFQSHSFYGKALQSKVLLQSRKSCLQYVQISSNPPGIFPRFFWTKLGSYSHIHLL